MKPARRPRPPFVLPWHSCTAPGGGHPLVAQAGKDWLWCDLPLMKIGRKIREIRGYAIHEAESKGDSLLFRRPRDEAPEAPLPIDAHRLAALALHGPEPKARMAAMELATRANNAVYFLNEVARQRPELFRPLARRWTHWPLLIGPNHRHNPDVPGMLKTLEVALGLSTGEDPTSKAGVDDTASVVARRLLDYLIDLRTRRRRYPPVVCDRMIKEARALPPFGKQTFLRWWYVAEAAMLESYPEPVDVPELAGIAPQSRGPKSRRRSHIMRKLRERFKAMAPLPA